MQPVRPRHLLPLSLTISLILLSACSKKVVMQETSEPVTVSEATVAAAPADGAAQDEERMEAIEVTGARIKRSANDGSLPLAAAPPAAPTTDLALGEAAKSETYAESKDSPIKDVAIEPISTFSIDVDTGSYSNVRRMLMDGYLPPRDAVRTEEFINYFNYDYPNPGSVNPPFSVTQEFAPSPWNSGRDLLLLGLKGYQVDNTHLPKSNLVFLLDVSGSMSDPDKLPLVKRAMRMLVEDLDADDSISIVVYAGAAGLVLPPTSGRERGKILAALDVLESGGSTNGGEGIELAYALAEQARIAGGINRIILCTDGDFNVGISDVDTLKTLVARKRESGISLSTLGFGTGNYNDAMAEQLANIGNGNHAYIDSLNEARKVLIEQRSGTFLTIASDVKVQIEFNPSVVAQYRLVGYQNRILRTEDFDDDSKDAGEIGAGHSVTALYELCLVGRPCDSNKDRVVPRVLEHELGYLKLRYKPTGQTSSQWISEPLHRRSGLASERLQLAAAVAGFADRLRGDAQVSGTSFAQLADLAMAMRSPDPYGYRAELIELMRRAHALAPVATEVSPKEVSR